MRSVITVTESANDYVSGILETNPGMMLMVGYDNKGCSGHKYTFELVDQSSVGPNDEVVDLRHGSIIIPSMYLIGLLGSTLDLVVNQFDRYLQWDNPMATNHCGCGESFQLSGEKQCKV